MSGTSGEGETPHRRDTSPLPPVSPTPKAVAGHPLKKVSSTNSQGKGGGGAVGDKQQDIESFGHKLRKRFSSDAFLEGGREMIQEASTAVQSAASHNRTSSLTMGSGPTAGLGGMMPGEAEYGTFDSPLKKPPCPADPGGTIETAEKRHRASSGAKKPAGRGSKPKSSGGVTNKKKKEGGNDNEDCLSLPSSLENSMSEIPLVTGGGGATTDGRSPTQAATPVNTGVPGDYEVGSEQYYVALNQGICANFVESRKFLPFLFKIALPITASNFMRNLSMVFTVFFLGHFLARDEFAGVAMGLTFANLTAISVGIGFSSALDTLCSQEYGKNPKSTVLGIYLQRAMVVSCILYIPTAIFYAFFAEKTLALMIPETTAYYAAEWLKFSPPITLPMVLSSCVQKFAQTQGEANVTFKASFVGILTNPILLYIGRSWGLRGFAVALAVNRWLSFSAVCFLVSRIPKLNHNFGTWSRKCLDWPAMRYYMGIGFPSALAFCADFWGFEAMAVVSGHLGDVQVAAWMVMMNIYTPMFGPCIGISSAACVKVGNELGAGNPKRARLMSMAGLQIACVLAVVGSCVIYFLGPYIFEGLTSDQAVVKKGRSILIVAQLTYFLDVFFFVFQGIFRGCGKQSVSAFVLCTCLWGIGVPGAYFLAVKEHFDLIGVSIGLTTGIAVVIPILVWYYIQRFDWVILAKAAALKRTSKSSSSAPAPSTSEPGPVSERTPLVPKNRKPAAQ